MDMQNIKKQPIGSLKISQDVIAMIANYAACEVDGVVSLADEHLPIRNLIRKGAVAKPIQINLNDDVAVVDIGINLRWGTRIPEVSEILQKEVKDAVQNMTGITVSKVNVHIAGIVFLKETIAHA